MSSATRKARRALARRQKAAVLSGVDDSRAWIRIFDSYPGAWQANVTVDREAVIANWAVFACMTLIAGDVGKLPLRLMEQGADRIWRETRSPAFSPVMNKPNGYQTRQKFIESWMFSKLSQGNTYALKVRDNRGVVTALHVLDPSRVKPLVSERGEVFYQLGDDELAGLESDVPAAPASEIIHDRMWCIFHPLVGLSPIFASGLAATQGLNIQGNSSKFFANMSRPSGILTAPGSISDAVADRIKTQWEKNYGADNVGRTAVLGDGLKYEAMAITPQDALLVEQLKI
ncbi:MAG TPA: phage portal protein, partial [Burkholderiaceae bacterium]|nr:phage portal protein [Burkholderiaceae bacterium]